MPSLARKSGRAPSPWPRHGAGGQPREQGPRPLHIDLSGATSDEIAQVQAWFAGRGPSPAWLPHSEEVNGECVKAQPATRSNGPFFVVAGVVVAASTSTGEREHQ